MVFFCAHTSTVELPQMGLALAPYFVARRKQSLLTWYSWVWDYCYLPSTEH